MSELNANLQELKNQTIDTMHLVRGQLIRSREAFLTMDTSISREVKHYEDRVNATELSIDKACEHILATLHPSGTELRFVIATLRINGHLERLGDHAYGIAKYVSILKDPFDKELIQRVKFMEMFEVAISMMDDVMHAFNFEDARLARNVFGKDTTLNEINEAATKIISDEAKAHPDLIEKFFFLFSVMRKVERMGDLVKNVAEETIFYLDGKVLRHKEKE